MHDRKERRVDRVETDDAVLIVHIRRVEIAEARLDDVLEFAKTADRLIEDLRKGRTDHFDLSLRVKALDRVIDRGELAARIGDRGVAERVGVIRLAYGDL